ncbi:LysR family transcriptional regulator [Rhodovarius crocodyli]|uniref:LysR family transcriptional regulator n=1 Tax=Rhodovarius crocodyli TaxID=1979269 RepID=A0A437LXB7_9PROT|nr:LysR family transcriptional regulator [Rhodovarius crocodyli]RVT90024.1 LysR family transcriptional regulator [Rhodovarius crocodyli]
MERLDCDRMFVAVLELGSFAAAAQRLGTSSGQASKLVSRLESDLGVQLLKRTTRALSPTELGQAYHARIKPLLEEFDALDASIRHASGAPSGRLRLTAPLSFGTVQLAAPLLDFAHAFPAIELDVSFTDRTVNLVDEGFDAAIRIGTTADSSLMARRLCPVRIVLAASPAYLGRRGTPQVPEDLPGHDAVIDTNFRDPANWRLLRDGRPVVVPMHGRLRFGNAEACTAAAVAGLGITRVPSFIAGPAFRAGTLRPVLEAFEDHPSALHALYPPGRHLAGKVRVLVDFLAACFRGTPAWDQGWRGIASVSEGNNPDIRG